MAKLLGRGWQYSTYDVGNGRVLKRYNSKLVGYAHMIRQCFPFTHDPLWKLPAYYRGCRETAIDSIRKLRSAPLDPWMMGNPKILNDLDYEQDKLVPLHDYLADADELTGKKTIDEFVEFNKVLVQRKLIDKSFNIGRNFARDTRSRIVLMDLGELYSSDAAIQRQISERAWSKAYITDALPAHARQYFIQRMDETFLPKADRIAAT